MLKCKKSDTLTLFRKFSEIFTSLVKFALDLKGTRKFMKKRGWGTKVLVEKGQNEPVIRKSRSKMAKNFGHSKNPRVLGHFY